MPHHAIITSWQAKRPLLYSSQPIRLKIFFVSGKYLYLTVLSFKHRLFYISTSPMKRYHLKVPFWKKCLFRELA